MNNPLITAILAGVCFGIYPLFLNRSGLNGNTASAMFSLMVLAWVFPLALYSNGLVRPSANWLMFIFAGVFGAIGTLSFNGMLARVTPAQIGSFFLVVIVAQITAPTIYHIIITGELSLKMAAGIVLAIAAAFLLL